MGETRRKDSQISRGGTAGMAPKEPFSMKNFPMENFHREVKLPQNASRNSGLNF